MEAKIAAVKDIPLSSLVIGKGQVRLFDVEKGIDELAASMAKIGQLEPIIVCPTKEKGKFEILTGQRRFLAAKRNKWEKIRACVLDREVDEFEAKVISVTENMVRRDLTQRDLIDVCTTLYQKYGSAKGVADETGLPYPDVNLYLKYDRLAKDPELKKLADATDPIKAAKTGKKVSQIVATVPAPLRQSLEAYAKDKGTTMDAAVGSLIEDALAGKGYLP